MVKKKIFLASSSELKEDRDQFEILINRINKKSADRNEFLELTLWEDFLDAVSKTRLQDEYNQAVRECDVFVMLYCTKVGQYTEEEFETAFGQFKATNKPHIFTYFKDKEISTGSASQKDLTSLWAFQQKLRALGHFQTTYKNIDELKLHFSQQIEKLALFGQLPAVDRPNQSLLIQAIDLYDDTIYEKVDIKLRESGPFSLRENDLLKDAIDLVTELVQNSIQHGMAKDVEVQVCRTYIKLFGGRPYPIDKLLNEGNRRGGATALLLLREACEDSGDSLLLKDCVEASEQQRSGYLLSTRSSYLEGKAKVDFKNCLLEINADELHDPFFIECLELELTRRNSTCQEFSLTLSASAHSPVNDHSSVAISRHQRAKPLWQMPSGVKIRYADNRIRRIIEKYEEMYRK